MEPPLPPIDVPQLPPVEVIPLSLPSPETEPEVRGRGAVICCHLLQQRVQGHRLSQQLVANKV